MARKKSITFDILVKHFGKGREGLGYKFPKAVYFGSLSIKEGESIEFILKGKGEGLPISICWEYGKKIRCITKRKRGNVCFVLLTETPAGKPLISSSINGHKTRSGRFTNWSASIIIYKRKQ